jgi:hypothetical protein
LIYDDITTFDRSTSDSRLWFQAYISRLFYDDYCKEL